MRVAIEPTLSVPRSIAEAHAVVGPLSTVPLQSSSTLLHDSALGEPATALHAVPVPEQAMTPVRKQAPTPGGARGARHAADAAAVGLAAGAAADAGGGEAARGRAAGGAVGVVAPRGRGRRVGRARAELAGRGRVDLVRVVAGARDAAEAVVDDVVAVVVDVVAGLGRRGAGDHAAGRARARADDRARARAGADAHRARRAGRAARPAAVGPGRRATAVQLVSEPSAGTAGAARRLLQALGAHVPSACAR